MTIFCKNCNSELPRIIKEEMGEAFSCHCGMQVQVNFDKNTVEIEMPRKEVL